MRVLHLTWSLGLGGAESLLVDLANCQARQAEVLVFILNRAIDPGVLAGFADAVRVTCLNRAPGGRNPLPLLKIAASIRAARPDFVHCHHPSLRPLLALCPAPRGVTIHGTHERVPVSGFERLFAISGAVARDLQQKAVVVPNGICCDAIRVANGRGKPPFRLVSVARLDSETKGQDILLRALAWLRERGMEDIRLDLVGEGPSRAALDRLARELGLESRVRFCGALPRPAVYSRLADYDLLVQPSRREGFGLSAAEAMAARIPVLVSNVAGPMEIIAEGELGYWFRSGDAGHCAEAIARIRAEVGTAEFYRRLDRARNRVRERYSIEATAQAYLAQYRDAMRCGKTSS